MSKITSKVKIVNKDDQDTNPATEDTLKQILGFDIPKYDFIELGYTGSDMTSVKYRIGGSTGTIVAQLTLTWNSGNLISVSKV